MSDPVKRILDFFQQINAIPRCSKKEKEINDLKQVVMELREELLSKI